MSGISPLKSKPLRNPGQSLDEEIDRQIHDRFSDFVIVAACLSVVAGIEVIQYLTDAPRQPWIFVAMAVAAIAAATVKFFGVKKLVRNLKLGRDGEQAVGQFLERLRTDGAQVFHDIAGENFNLDHVVISTRGIYAIETKTWSKPHPKATITVEGDRLLAAGQTPDRNPVEQASAAARWLRHVLLESTGQEFKVQGVVVFPGWWIDRKQPGPVWVLEPKALPKWIRGQSESILPSDVALASSHLTRYIRSTSEKVASP